MKIALTALSLILAPALAMAECQWGSHSKDTASSCQQGSSWDTASQRCVPSTTS